MNKKLVAVAIAGLLAAPLAQAQTANVTLYGRANMNMAFVNGGQFSAATGNTNPTVFRVDSNSSRFGIRGTESLDFFRDFFEYRATLGSRDAAGGKARACRVLATARPKPLPRRDFTLPRVHPVWHNHFNFSTLQRRFRWQAQEALVLPILSARGETP